ncbi:myc target protein 1 homolog [Clupea harengus]|uniref:Myc target protein 1 homolog n=1 Tax=Clupea harengus TaxID=7950 RepID=A0A6P3WEU5_CLUHA|nr:myc target protein 1 homolog [Clupea harengus]
MAENNTHPILELLQSFDLRDLILAFCLSMVVGLLLGALVYMVLTWMSRRQASASITRRASSRPSRSTTAARSASSPRSRPGFHRSSSSGYDRRSNNSLASAAFSFHRQGSSPPDQADALLGRKSSFRASTFHPLLQVSQIAREAEEGGGHQTPRTLTLTRTPTTLSAVNTSSASTSPSASKPRPGSASSPPSASKPRPDSFWGNSGLRIPHPSQTPPPAYESIIRAYQETCT